MGSRSIAIRTSGITSTWNVAPAVYAIMSPARGSSRALEVGIHIEAGTGAPWPLSSLETCTAILLLLTTCSAN
jgi:hypothetical protein